MSIQDQVLLGILLFCVGMLAGMAISNFLLGKIVYALADRLTAAPAEGQRA